MTQLILAYNFPAKHLAKLRMAAMKLGVPVRLKSGSICKASARLRARSEHLKASMTEKISRS